MTGPIAAYTNPDLAWTHARSMLGAEMTSMPVSRELPGIVRDDLGTDFGEDETPVESHGGSDDDDR